MRGVNWRAVKWVLFLLIVSSHERPAIAQTDEWRGLTQALENLARAPSGKKLVESAKKNLKAAALEKIFQPDEVSHTVSQVKRQFNLRTGKATEERETRIHLKRDLSPTELLFDIAHELTHATFKPNWDPYDPNLTLGGYLWIELEGPGGEIDAVVSECLVAIELKSEGQRNPRCQGYLVETDSHLKVDRAKIREDLYRSGDAYSEVLARLGDERARFPLLSSRSPILQSATMGSPYPVALLRTYDELTKTACTHSKRRLEARNLASEADETSAKTQEFLKRRCSSQD